MHNSADAPTISIQKTWILPPKPKPGRKPAIDTPPTKRKAQNREAQRAFRERRAAKVGELEEEMKKMEEQDTREQEALRDKIGQLERDVQEYGDMVEMWRGRFNDMQMACGRETQLRQSAELEVMALRKAISSGTEAVPLPPRRPREYDYNSEQQSNGTPNIDHDGQNTEDMEQVDLTCGNCSADTRCQCIEEAFEMSNIASESDQNPKRPHSPTPTDPSTKRLRPTPPTEIDFTPQFTTRRPPPLSTSTSTASSIPASAPPDPCGFCQDGTPCICAELAKDNSRTQPTKAAPPDDPGINGPGTCPQCLANPTSTLFCKSVAANRNLPSTVPLPSTPNTLPPHPTTATVPPVRITCADAFDTLSRHPGFSAATNELNTWVPQLTALPKLYADGAVLERTAFDIEAASVMSVLGMFDRRFGGEGGRGGV